MVNRSLRLARMWGRRIADDPMAVESDVFRASPVPRLLRRPG